MQISASVRRGRDEYETRVSTNDNAKTVAIPPRQGTPGSSVNGGELLLLALATCYCNDIYREAAKRGIAVEQVEVEVFGEFGAEGEAGANLRYRAKVVAGASEAEIAELIAYTDTVAEIQNTLRAGSPVELTAFEAISTGGIDDRGG